MTQRHFTDDFRAKVLADVDAGMVKAAVARKYDISSSLVGYWLKNRKRYVGKRQHRTPQMRFRDLTTVIAGIDKLGRAEKAYLSEYLKKHPLV